MMYIDLIEPTPESPGEVRVYLSHSPDSADRFTFDEVLAGKLDETFRIQIGPGAPDELKAAVRQALDIHGRHAAFRTRPG